MSRICQVCKTDNLADAIYCDHCGTPLSKIPAGNKPMGDMHTIIDDPGALPPSPPRAVTTFKPRLVVASSKITIGLASDDSIWIVGRQDPKRGFMPDIDLMPHGGVSGGVSRRHAKLTIRDHQCFIEDLNSANATYVNGSKVTPGSLELLQNGDQIRFGGVIINYYSE